MLLRSDRSQISLGYVPLCDCAPLAVAKELGLFERHGLKVQLSREPGWATMRDKIFYGEIDAAQSIAGLAFSLGMGLSGLRREVAVPLILSAHGNAITLSSKLDPARIGRGEGLAAYLTHGWKENRPFTLAATHRYSSHYLLLHAWLKRHGVLQHANIEFVFLPPPLMARHLKAGHIDGYCVGEPWNSVAILDGCGWCPAVSSEIASGHPEKILLVSDNFLNERRDEAIALTAALLESCELCQRAEFRSELVRILSQKQYTGVDEEVLQNSFGNVFVTGRGNLENGNLLMFHGGDLNLPTPDKASWFLSGMRTAGLLPDTTHAISLSTLYRQDLFRAAEALIAN